jgi:DNA invertase Pin-like site-specific DNA recombinase
MSGPFCATWMFNLFQCHDLASLGATLAIDLQRDALIAAGVDPAQIYEYRASGRLDARPGLDATLKALRTGDTLVVWKLDRLGRNLRHLVNTVHDLTKQGVGFKVLTGHGASIDTTTPALRHLRRLSEFERELISERTRAGLASARARGRKGGAPFKMTVAKVRLAMAAMGKPKTKVGDLCRELGVTRQTLYRHVSPAGNLREDGRKLLKTNPYRSPHWLML